MATQSEIIYVITPTGNQRWDITKRDLQVEQSITDSLCIGVSRKNPRIAKIGGDYGNAGVAMSGVLEMWSVRVTNLKINAPFFLKDGIHTPAFADNTQPLMTMEWKPQMTLVLVITVLKDTMKNVHYAGDHYLVAMDNRGGMWRLPLSNIYEDCRLCHGQAAHMRETSLEVVMECCDLFGKSQWNTDLYNGEDRKRCDATARMFRWKPLEKGFQQLEILPLSGKDWTSLCMKVATEKLSQFVQIP